MQGVRRKGEIPEVEETYAFMNVAYPCMNEHGLAIGETTIGGNRELRNSEGLFLIENLQEIVLQRCTTAREAIRLIGELVKEYGYGDNGECLTFADSKEVWHFEIFGAGPLEIGAVWAAVRIPDDHVGVSANIPRISELDLNDPDHFMASDNVHSLAEEMGYWDPSSGEPFKFWAAYTSRDREGNPRKPFSTRELFILSTLAPDLNLSMDMDELPFSVKPNHKVSVQEVMNYYRQTYEGTDLDMSKNLMTPQRRFNRETREWEELPPAPSPIVNNWILRGDMGQLLNRLQEGTVRSQRTIAISACSYSQVIQCRDWLPPEVGTVAWFSFDNPGQSPRIPIFAGTLELPDSFEICGQDRFRTDSACWWFRRANRLAMIKWGVTREYIEGAVRKFEVQAIDEFPFVEATAVELLNAEGREAMRRYLTDYTNRFARATMQEWWELGDYFFTMFARGW
jgi:dipeptidase